MKSDIAKQMPSDIDAIVQSILVVGLLVLVWMNADIGVKLGAVQKELDGK